MSNVRGFSNKSDEYNEKNSALIAQSISSYLKNDVILHLFDTIDSTNNEAKRNSSLSLDIPHLFVSKHQSAGRGRLGRSFYSPKDTGLYMSLMIQPPKDTNDILCMTSLAAVCVAKALMSMCDKTTQIKWVNDIYLNEKKVCGILCEAVTNPENSKITGIVIGIGINISTDNFPTDLQQIATCIGQDIDQSLLCAKITDNIINECKNIASREFISTYKELSMVLGREITYYDQDKKVTATAVDIDRDGGLIVQTQEGIKTLSTGEISVRLS